MSSSDMMAISFAGVFGRRTRSVGERLISSSSTSHEELLQAPELVQRGGGGLGVGHPWRGPLGRGVLVEVAARLRGGEEIVVAGWLAASRDRSQSPGALSSRELGLSLADHRCSLTQHDRQAGTAPSRPTTPRGHRESPLSRSADSVTSSLNSSRSVA
jgi:hypothetical protein